MYLFSVRSPANQHLAKHLQRERDAMFTVLYLWGGNHTERGAHSQNVLVSMLETGRQQFRLVTEFLRQLLHLRKPQALGLTPTTPR
jgi:hypothetical protein